MGYSKIHRIHPASVWTIKYRRRFALLPTRCSNKRWIWMHYYIEKCKVWIDKNPRYADWFCIEKILEDEFIIRKLTDNL